MVGATGRVPDRTVSTGGRSVQAIAVELLRIGVGVVWALNLVFVVDPANRFFSGFQQLALSFGPTTLGGAGLPDYVAAHAGVFSWIVAAITAYLAVAFLLGLSTRWACLVGGVFSAILLATQVGSTFLFPGGTDVGEHPLYMLIYVVLVVGGAGSAYSLDEYWRVAWARRADRAAARPKARPRPVGAFALSYRFFLVYFVAGTLVAFGVTLGLMVAIPTPPSATGTAAGPVSYENLTISINPTNGWPQYSPANFTVHTGRVIFTITDLDSPTNWSACPCVVAGTENDLEYVNGTPVHGLSDANVAHTFNVPNLGIATYSPGLTTVRFTVDLINPGQFLWFCFAPCGAGANPYASPPMGVAGYMTGTMSIVA